MKAQVGGKIAQIGSRLVDGAAQKLADDFFGRFSNAVAAKVGAAPTAVAPASIKPLGTGHLAIAIAIVAGLVLAYLIWRSAR